MGYFPMCMDIADRLVILVGNGEQIRDKMKKLSPFSPRMLRLDRLSEADLAGNPVFVVAGDLDAAEAERTAMLCAHRHIPVNVVDMPRLCTFSFPAMIANGDLTVAVSTGGKAPGAAAYLRAQIEQIVPDNAQEILDWLCEVRLELGGAYPPAQRAALMRAITVAAFERRAPLPRVEWMRMVREAQ